MTTLEPALRLVLLLVYATSAVLAAGHALLHRPDPRSAWGWIAVCWLAPVAGPLLYLLLGIDRVKIRARRAVGPPTRGPGTASAMPDIAGVSHADMRELVRIGAVVTGEPLLPGNAVEVLHNGEQAYPAMLAAIDQAQHSVCLMTYIFEGARIGERFVQALAAAQTRGVKVRVLIDGIGDYYYRPRGSKLLEKSGVPVRLFQVSRSYPLPNINLRNHRKLLVVDGHTAFTGGMNIGDHHMVRWKREPNVDLHFRVQGPVVAQLTAVFAADWRYAARETLPPASPDVPAKGNAYCRSLAEGPNEELDRLHLVLLGALATAHDRVRIMTPYFIPTPELSGALASAAMRGVSIELMLPVTCNLPWLDWATRHWLPPLITRGVRVLWRPVPFSHAKMFLVDHYYALIGSANLDPRSLRLNFELQLEVYDTGFATALGHHFDNVKRACTEATLKELRALSLPVRLRNAIVWLFSPYL